MGKGIQIAIEAAGLRDLNAEVEDNQHPFRIKPEASAPVADLILRTVSKPIHDTLLQTTDLGGTFMWDFLYAEFAGKNYARKIEEIKALATFRYGPGSVRENMLRITSLINATKVHRNGDFFN